VTTTVTAPTTTATATSSTSATATATATASTLPTKCPPGWYNNGKCLCDAYSHSQGWC
jgi:hypothetical protein